MPNKANKFRHIRGPGVSAGPNGITVRPAHAPIYGQVWLIAICGYDPITDSYLWYQVVPQSADTGTPTDDLYTLDVGDGSYWGDPTVSGDSSPANPGTTVNHNAANNMLCLEANGRVVNASADYPFYVSAVIQPNLNSGVTPTITQSLIFTWFDYEFYARLTTATLYSLNRWQYAFVEVIPNSNGTFNDLPNGITGSAWNTTESQNSGSGIQGDGIDPANLPGGVNILAPGIPVVKITATVDCAGAIIYFFQLNDLYGGSCSSGSDSYKLLGANITCRGQVYGGALNSAIICRDIPAMTSLIQELLLL